MVLMIVVIQKQGSAGNPFETHDKSFILRLFPGLKSGGGTVT